MKYGYARVSTDDQTPALQLAALKRAGCKTVFKDEGLSGATTKRPALSGCLKTLQEGDTLIVWKLDRLGRSLCDLIAMLDDLRARGVKFRSLTEAIDTDTPTGRAMWQMIGVLAELERSLISERTRAGVKAAQSRGVKFGRKRKLSRNKSPTLGRCLPRVNQRFMRAFEFSSEALHTRNPYGEGDPTIRSSRFHTSESGEASKTPKTASTGATPPPFERFTTTPRACGRTSH
jgi:DNA invertase Pin-like site-specific DNA recombinase